MNPYRAIVFGPSRPSFLAARTLRAVLGQGIEGEDFTGQSPQAIAGRLADDVAPIWFLRGGCWPAHQVPSAALPGSSTRHPLCALGATRVAPGMAADADAAAWKTALAATGGSFDIPARTAEGDSPIFATMLRMVPAKIGTVPNLPPLDSIYMEPTVVAAVAEHLNAGQELTSAVLDALRAPGRRVVHVAALDVYRDNSLRVAQVVTSLQRGGAERIAVDLHRAMGETSGHSMLIALGHATRTAFPTPATTVDVSSAGDRAGRAATALRAVRAFGADVIHGHLLDAADLRLFAAADTPLVSTIHNMRPGWPNGLESMAAGDATLLVACAYAVEDELRTALKGDSPIPIRTVWNGVDFGPFTHTPAMQEAACDMRRRLGIASDAFVLVALANPRPQKRMERLPAIVAATREEFVRRKINRDVVLLVAGQPSRVNPTAAAAEAAIRAAIDEHRLNGQVHFLGAVEEVPLLLAASDALVCASGYEGLSLAHVEAVAADRPVVATDVGGTAELAWENPAVRLLHVDAAPQQFATVLADIAETPPASGRAVAEKQFSTRRMAAGYRRLYAAAIHAHGRVRGARNLRENGALREAVAQQIDGDTPLDVPCATHQRSSASLHAPNALGENGALREAVAQQIDGDTPLDVPCATHQRSSASLHAPNDRPEGLCLITNNFSTGGAQSSAARLLRGLAAEGIAVRAAVLQEQIGDPTPGRRRLETAGVPVVALPPTGTIDTADAVAELCEHIAAEPPQAVVLWNVIPEYKVLLADMLVGVPLFDVSPGEMYFASLERYFCNPRPGLPYRTAREYGARLAGVIVKYQAEAELAAERLGAAVHVVANGVPLDPMPVVHTRRSTLRLGTAARISPQKKLEELLLALKIVAAQMPHYELRIAGGPEPGSDGYQRQLREMAAGLNVRWLGDLEDPSSFYRDLDLFVMISEPAGCPNASLEAMSAGLPVVCTDVGGAAEQVVDGCTGRIVPRGDTVAFGEAMLRYACDSCLRASHGTAGRQRIADHFDVARMVGDYRRILGLHDS